MPVLLPTSPFSRCSFAGMVFQCKCVVLICSSVHPCSDKSARYFASLYHLSRRVLAMTIRWKFGFSQHIHVLSNTLFDAMMDHAWTLGLVLLYFVSRDRQHVTSVFVDLSTRIRRLHAFSACAIYDTNFPIRRSCRTRRSHDWNSWSPPISQSLSATLSCLGDFSNCSNNRPTVSLQFVSTCSTVECGMPGIRKSTRLQLQVSLCLWTSFSRSSDFLESVISTSLWACCEFGTSVTRGSLGNWYTFAAEFFTSFHAYNFFYIFTGSVLERVIACDRVW